MSDMHVYLGRSWYARALSSVSQGAVHCVVKRRMGEASWGHPDRLGRSMWLRDRQPMLRGVGARGRSGPFSQECEFCDRVGDCKKGHCDMRVVWISFFLFSHESELPPKLAHLLR
eukprot:6284843-Pyramimonas_sp.AAC.1